MVEFRMATKDDKHLPTYDFTKLSAINTCPTWGILRYTKHKSMHHGGRAMALEAGKLMHECFAAVRLYQLGVVQGCLAQMDYTGEKLFGSSRWEAISCAMGKGGDHQTRQRNAAWECLATGNYVDDPDDKKRTYVNLETSMAYYVERWDNLRYPVWIRDIADPYSDVGIEIAFDIVVNTPKPFRMTGRVDGIHVDRDSQLVIQENKTAWSLDRAWRQAFQMSHQVTGYTIAASAFANVNVERGLVIGLTIPVKRSLIESLAYEPTLRPDYMKEAWLTWAQYTIAQHDAYVDDVFNAPKFTHSCNRYFRPCSMIPFCASDKEDQKLLLDAMHTEEWSPLHETQTGD